MIFYNTLTSSKETLKPIDPQHVKMYVCGPTVYARPHLGNARPAVVFDVLFRLLQTQYKCVTYVRNITDVDDKIEQASQARGIPIAELTAQTTKWYHEDLNQLNVLAPTHEPRATHHIDDMIAMIQTLVDKGHAYSAEGHVLFAVNNFSKYGQLSKRSLEDMRAGARVDVAPYKKDPGDFVLWKPSSQEQSGWESPWGRGRPGWHIECSAMSKRYLGETFDIHGGGVDLTFPHHENEIAQSCAAHDCTHMAHIWMHNGHITWDGEKMSKSLGNIVLLHDLLKNIPGPIIRLAMLGTHYRQPLHWSDKHVEQAQVLYQKLQSFVGDSIIAYTKGSAVVVEEALSQDLNTPLAISHLHNLLKDNNKEGVLSALWFLGVDVKSQESKALPEEAAALIEQRTLARQNKQWAESDRLRDELKAIGIAIKDTPEGMKWFWDDATK